MSSEEKRKIQRRSRYKPRKKYRIFCSNATWDRWLVYRHTARVDKPAELIGNLLDLWYRFNGLDEKKCAKLYHASVKKTSKHSRKTASQYNSDQQHSVNGWPAEDCKALTVIGSGSDSETEDYSEEEFNVANSVDEGDENTNHKTSNTAVQDVLVKGEKVELVDGCVDGTEESDEYVEIKVEKTDEGFQVHVPSGSDMSVKRLIRADNDGILTDVESAYEGLKKRSSSCKVEYKPKRRKDNKELENADVTSYSTDDTCEFEPDVKTKGPSHSKKTKEKKWIKINLNDHKDKYSLETVESFAQKDRRSNVSEELFCCLVCKQFKCASRDNMEEHVEKHVNKSLECHVCNYVAFSDRDLNRHKYDAGHTHKKKFVCDKCGVALYSLNARKLHMGSVHHVAQFQCKFCPLFFESEKIRAQHMRSDHEEECQFCPTCRKMRYTLSKEDFQKHLDTCQVSRERQCQICGVKLSDSNCFRRHMQDRHLGIRQFKCDMCPYTAKTAKRLEMHTLAHTGTHPYRCDQCTFTCVQRTQLSSHMRTHSGEKPFKCTQCKYTAAWNVQLKDHLKVHSMETAVTCQECDILFKNVRTFDMHWKKEHTGIK